MRWRKAAWILGCACLLFCPRGTAFAAESGWQLTDQDYRYQREDGSAATGGWEAVDGDWYYFDRNGIMQTGWQKIGNFWYFFGTDGVMADGWQFCGEVGSWFFYDVNAQVKTGWLFDGGEWYWLNPDGTLNQEPLKTIRGETYEFHEDGALKAGEFSGFSYYDGKGRRDLECDIRAERADGSAAAVEKGAMEEIGREASRLSKGWLQKFAEDGGRFVYCPEQGHFSSVRGEDGNLYRVRYRLDPYQKLLRFTDRDALLAGFGEYMYQVSAEELKTLRFPEEAAAKADAVREITGLPRSFDKNYRAVFGALVSAYMDEDGKKKIDDQLGVIGWIVGTVIESRDADGRPVWPEW